MDDTTRELRLSTGKATMTTREAVNTLAISTIFNRSTVSLDAARELLSETNAASGDVMGPEGLLFPTLWHYVHETPFPMWTFSSEDAKPFFVGNVTRHFDEDGSVNWGWFAGVGKNGTERWCRDAMRAVEAAYVAKKAADGV